MRPDSSAAPLRHRGRWIAAGSVVVVAVAAAIVGVNLVSSRAQATSAATQALTTQREAWKHFTTDRATVDGQDVRLDRPVGVPMRGLAVFIRGLGGDINSDMGSNSWLGSLRTQGWAIAASDFHGDSWGSPDAVNDLTSLSQWATARTGLPVRLLVAGSMGATLAINALAHGFDTTCLYTVMPVVNLTSVGHVIDAEDQIHALYPGEASLDAANPITKIDHLPAINYHVRSSPQDTLVPAEANADVLVRWLQLTGRSVSVTHASGQHGSPSHFDASDLDGFAKGCLAT